MSHLITGLVLAAALRGANPAITNPDATLDRYEKECPAGATTDDCRALRAQVEQVLYADLLRLESFHKPIDPEALKVAAGAASPFLQAFALRHLASNPDAEARQRISAGFESPYRIVRSAAREAAQRMGDEKLRALSERFPHQVGEPGSALAPDPLPTDGELGAPLYPGATYRYFASGPARALYTTRDPPEKVLAFYARGGKQVLTGAQLDALQKQAFQRPDPEMMARMMRDPRAAMELSRQMQQGAAGMVKWTEGIEGQRGIEGARYVVLEERQLMGGRSPSRVVVVWQDAILGATAIDFPRPPVMAAGGLPSPLMEDPKGYQRYMETQELIYELITPPEPPSDR